MPQVGANPTFTQPLGSALIARTMHIQFFMFCSIHVCDITNTAADRRNRIAHLAYFTSSKNLTNARSATSTGLAAPNCMKVLLWSPFHWSVIQQIRNNTQTNVDYGKNRWFRPHFNCIQGSISDIE